jgi:hypothetical protein
MSNKLAGLLTAIFIFATAFAASLLASGCGGEVPGPDNDSAGFSVGGGIGTKPIVLPAPALIEWQFDACITQDQRDGLIQALQQMHAWAMPELSPSVGLSVCGTDGMERGALFAANTNATGRNITVSRIAINVVQRHYAFMLTRHLLDVVGAAEYAKLQSKLTLRFDDGGYASATGRYQITGWQMQAAPDPKFPPTHVLLHVLDTQTQKTADIDSPGWIGLTCCAQIPGLLLANQKLPQVSPASSTDPFVQIVINAANKYVQRYSLTLATFAPYSSATYALNFGACPSLAGWPLPFDLVIIDGAGDITGAGGEQIM